MINLHLFFLKLGTSNKDVACILKKVLIEDTTETYALKFSLGRLSHGNI